MSDGGLVGLAVRNSCQPRHTFIIATIVGCKGQVIQKGGRGDPGVGTFDAMPPGLGSNRDFSPFVHRALLKGRITNGSR